MNGAAALFDPGRGRIVGFATGAGGRPALARLSLDGVEVAARLAVTPVARLGAAALGRLAADVDAPCGFALSLPRGARGRDLTVEATTRDGAGTRTLLRETFECHQALTRYQEGSIMADSLTLQDLTLAEGVFHGRLTRPAAPAAAEDDPAPRVDLLVGGASAGAATLFADPGGAPGVWRLSAPLPAAALTDGALMVVFAAADGSVLARYPVAAGDALAGDLAIEVASLRAELDQLKRAFRSTLAGGVIPRGERPLIVAEALAEVDALLEMRDRATLARRSAASGAEENDDEAVWVLEDD